MPAVLLAGPPASGKTTLAQALAARLEGHVLNKDQIRAATFGPNFVAYSHDQDDFLHKFMVAAAYELWATKPGLWIIFDGRTYSRAVDRAAVPPHFSILCTAPPEIIRDRLELPHPAANRDFDLYESVCDSFEPITTPHLIVDTTQPLDLCVEQALAYLQQQSASIPD